MECVGRINPELLVGVSTHDLDQLRAALDSRPTYAAFGPVYATASKANPEPATGLALLQQAHQLAREASVPLVAIGGVNETTLGEVAAHCDYVAAIGLLLPAATSSQPYALITRRCSLFNAQIQTTRGLTASSG
jgi:thiamine-phosphate diphosphorylase